MNKIKVIGLMALVAGVSLTWAKDKENELTADQLPSAVLTAVKAACPAGVIKEAELEEDDGVMAYEVELVVNGKECELKISAEGKMLEMEQPIDPKELPVAVRTTLTLFSKGKITTALRVTEEDEVVYEVLLKQGKSLFEIELSEAGLILEQELKNGKKSDDDDDD